MNNLIVFDIDGTLINYINYEDKAYLEAVTAVTGIQQISTAWASYQYSTDSGVLSEIFEQTFKRAPEHHEVISIKDKFISYLANSFRHNPGSCLCIPGAKKIFSQIREVKWDIAIATGGWQESAVMKLETAKIPYDKIPMAHSDDHYDRKNIIMTAVERAKDFYDKDTYQNIIYVGDALWDLKASRDLNINFIGIGSNLDPIKDGNFFHINDYETCHLPNYLSHFSSLS